VSFGDKPTPVNEEIIFLLRSVVVGDGKSGSAHREGG
jgi:hypothetical protein